MNVDFIFNFTLLIAHKFCRCNGHYILYITDDVPDEVKEYEVIQTTRIWLHCKCIHSLMKKLSMQLKLVKVFTSAGLSHSSNICKAFMSPYNYNHMLSNASMSRLPLGTKKKLRSSSSKRECFDVTVQF